jgi:hypothetical protein
MDDGMVFAALQVTAGTVRVAPVGPRNVRPPPEVRVQGDGAGRRREHDRARDEVLRRRAGEILRPRRSLGDRHVSRGLHELRELRVRHLRRVHPEAADAHAVDRLRVAEL